LQFYIFWLVCFVYPSSLFVVCLSVCLSASLDVTTIHNAADAVVVEVRSNLFHRHLVQALDAASKRLEKSLQQSRYGWMYGADIEVLSAIAMPTSGVRAIGGEEGDNTVVDDTGSISLQQINLFLLGVALTAVLILGVVIYMHMRLRQEHYLFEKDKGTLTAGGHALHKLLNKVAASAADTLLGPGGGGGGAASASASASALMNDRRQQEVEMSRRGLMDEDLED
jgi:hypothetical protein